MALGSTSLYKGTLAELLCALWAQVRPLWSQVKPRPRLAQGLMVLEPVWV